MMPKFGGERFTHMSHVFKASDLMIPRAEHFIALTWRQI